MPRPAPSRTPTSAIAFAVVLIFLVFALVFASAFVGGGSVSLVAPFCGFIVVVMLVMIVLAVSGFTGAQTRRIPPPPPIQQPMVPAGTPRPIELMCPNCGAAPRNVDRFGIATCDYCNTRFMVR